jgi:hypothetical protein
MRGIRLRHFLKYAAIVGICGVLLALLLGPSIRMQLHWRSYLKGAEQIRRELLKDAAFRFVRAHLGKGPSYPIVVYGYVGTDANLVQIEKILEPFRAKYEIDSRVTVKSASQSIETGPESPALDISKDR